MATPENMDESEIRELLMHDFSHYLANGDSVPSEANKNK